MKNAQIFITKDGSQGLYNPELDEIYHSREGAQKESIEKFIIPSDFEKRTRESDSIRVLDICYGIGYNSKNALAFYKNCNITIDALEIDKELVDYSPRADFFMPEINDFIAGKKELMGAKINFYIDDARKVIKTLNYKYDVIFLDAFAPNKLPTLWSVEFFKQIRRVIKETGVLVTYCSAQPVRKAMDISGFKLGKAEDEKGHSFATVAALDEAFIKTPLDDYELGLLNTKAAIPYRDKDLSASAGEMFKTREKEVQNSTLEGASAYIRRMKRKP